MRTIANMSLVKPKSAAQYTDKVDEITRKFVDTLVFK